MAKAVASAFRDAGFRRGTIVARNERAGRALAAACDYDFRADLGEKGAPLLVNVTPIGMSTGEGAGQLAFPEAFVRDAELVFDVVANPAETPLISLARQLRRRVMTGTDVIALQALDQFVLYTGIRPSAPQVAAAVQYATTGVDVRQVSAGSPSTM
jgi:shikimate dehydrogenase